MSDEVTSNLCAVVIDALEPRRVAEFWAGLLGRDVVADDGFTLPPVREPGFAVDVFPTSEPKRLPNRIHFDVTTTSWDDQRRLEALALELGGRHIDIGQGPDDLQIVMADPEGNELCLIEPGNGFLADTDVIGAVNCDGSQAVGYFWSAALGWPLVWDQDEETAIQSPLGGSKMAWGGPPLMPKPAKNRLHLDIAPPAGADQHAEVERLVSLGARRIDIGQGDVDWVVMADPDGNEFCVLTPR